MTQLISPEKFTKTVDLLRSFFLRKGFLEVHTQNRLSILAACEDPIQRGNIQLCRRGLATSPDRSNVVRTRIIISP